LSGQAQTEDIQHILTVSEQTWGIEGRVRYAAILAAALRKVAEDPEGPAIRDRSELMPGIRSFAIRHALVAAKTRVKRPVHVLYYRALQPGLIEIVRVLPQRMEPSRHLSGDDN
jgi:toxin ParE1/3/4